MEVASRQSNEAIGNNINEEKVVSFKGSKADSLSLSKKHKEKKIHQVKFLSSKI